MTEQDTDSKDLAQDEVKGEDPTLVYGDSKDDVTRIYGRRQCRECHYDNLPHNEYCFNCGAPLGSVPEFVKRHSVIAQTRASWRAYGLEVATIGRDGEVKQLLDSFVEVNSARRSLAVMLLGAEGVGKTRLISDFSQKINTEFGNAILISSAWFEGNDPYQGIWDRLLRSRLYIPNTLPEEEARQRLFQGIKAIVGEEDGLDIAQRVGQLIGLPFGEAEFHDGESHDATRIACWKALFRLFRMDAEANPLVLVMEDVHLASESSLALTSFMLRELRDSPVLFVMSGTGSIPSFQEDPLLKIPNLETIDLAPLSEQHIREMVSQVLKRADPIPDVIYQRVSQNALGNPLIAEEILRLLIAEGAIDTNGPVWTVHEEKAANLKVPSGFIEVIQASLKRLTPKAHQLISDAAVIGDVFWHGALTIIYNNLNPHQPERDFPWGKQDQQEDPVKVLLDRLLAEDLIVQRPESRYPDDLEYLFKHGSVCRLLRQEIDNQREQVIHGLLAEWREIHRGRQITERPEVIAQHHELAGNPVRACVYYLEAGRLAQANHENQETIRNFSKALELLPKKGYFEQRMEALHELGSVYHLLGEYDTALPYLQRMLQLSWCSASLGKGGAAHNKLGRTYRSLGDLELAMSHFDQALRLFRRANDKAGIASTIDDIGSVHSIKGNYSLALENYEEALKFRKELGDRRSMALSLNHMGSVCLYQGKPKEAMTYLREALTLRKELDDKLGVAQSLNNLGVILAERGNLEVALQLWNESQVVARLIGDRSLQCTLLNNLGEVAGMLGRWEEAEAYLEDAARLSERYAERRIIFDVLRNRALLELRRGEGERAQSIAKQLMDLAHKLDSRILEGIALRCLGEVYAHNIVGAPESEKRLRSAHQAFRKSINLLNEVGNDAELGRALLAYGVFLAEQQRPQDAIKRLKVASMVFNRSGMKGLLEKTQRLLEELDEEPTRGQVVD